MYSTENINSLTNGNKNYIITSINGERIIKGLVDTGNSINENVAISQNLHQQLGVGFKSKQQREIGTANKDSKLVKLGISNAIRLKISGIPREYEIYPAVIDKLSNSINIGIVFFPKRERPETSN